MDIFQLEGFVLLGAVHLSTHIDENPSAVCFLVTVPIFCKEQLV